jgi:hypothetical protein
MRQDSLKPRPKVIAASVTGAILTLVVALGIEVDEAVVAAVVTLAMGVAAYVKRD